MKNPSSYCIRPAALLLLAVSLLALDACGPIYNTEYILSPPKGARGAQCIEQCEDDASNCRSYQNSQKENCEYENQRLMDECSYRIQRDKGRSPKWTECGRQITCDFPESVCETGFHHCYRSCGGIVKEERTCIANCDEVKP